MKILDMMDKLSRRVGLSTACFYPEDTFSAFRRVADAGAPVAEVFMNAVDELTPSSLKRFRDYAKQSGTEILSLHPYTSAFESLLFFSEYGKRLNDGLELYKRFFDGAAQIGAKYLVFHGEKSTPTFSRELSSETQICEVYGRLIDLAESYGVTFTQENVNNHRSQSPVFLHYLNKQIPKIRFTFDLKQVYRAKQTYRDVISAMGEKIVHVHMNDFGENECCLPFDGYVNMPHLKIALDSVGYRNAFVLEVYRSCFREDSELIRAMNKTRALFCPAENDTADIFDVAHDFGGKRV